MRELVTKVDRVRYHHLHSHRITSHVNLIKDLLLLVASSVFAGHHTHCNKPLAMHIEGIWLLCYPNKASKKLLMCSAYQYGIPPTVGKEPFIRSHLFCGRLVMARCAGFCLWCLSSCLDQPLQATRILHHQGMCFFPKKSPLLSLQVWPNLQPAINPFTTNSINLFCCLNIYGCLRLSQGPGLCQRLGPELIHLELLQGSYLSLGVKS